MANNKYTVAQVKEILDAAEQEGRCALRIAVDKAVKGQAGSAFLPADLEIAKDRFIPYPTVEAKNILLASNLTYRKDEKGARQSMGEVAACVMPVTEEDLSNTIWKPETYKLLEAATNEYVEYANVFEKQSTRAIETDLLKKIAYLSQKQISIPNRKVVEFIQRARKCKPTDDVSQALDDGRIPLEKPITRIVAKLDKATDRIGYMPKERKDGKTPSFQYTFKIKGKKNPKTNKNDLIILRIPDKNGVPQDLTALNCHTAVTKYSILTGTLSTEFIISSQGISRKFKLRSAVVHPHPITEYNDIADEDIDQLDAFGEAYMPKYIAPKDSDFAAGADAKSNGYTAAASLTGTAERPITFDEPSANPIPDDAGDDAAGDAAGDDTAPEAAGDAAGDAGDAGDEAGDSDAAEEEPTPPPPPPPKPVARKPVKPKK